jgi:predicted nuclease of predicted toxin-antitoxin system
VNILVDENIPNRTVVALRALGHRVLDVRGLAAKGAPDDVVWAMAQREQALLLTTDKGFARRRSAAHHGILVIRLRQPNRERIHLCTMQAVQRFAEGSWPGQTVVIRDRTQSVRRIRPRAGDEQ